MKRKRKNRTNYLNSIIKRIILKGAILSILFGFLQAGTTGAYFVATANSTNNSVTAGDWEAPVTSISTLPSYTNTASFNLAYTATDSFSGVHHLELYISKDGGPYAKYNGNYAPGDMVNFDSSTTGGDGSYRFYTIGTDNATPANIEAAPGVPDATTIVDTTNPLAHAGSDQTVSSGTDVTFNGSLSYDLNGIASYKWDKDASDGVNFATPDLTGVNPTLTGGYSTTGIYTVTLQVTDNAGNMATDTMTVTVIPGSGSVVINELMWMGSVGNSNDEWIELRNTTGQGIDLSGWQLTKWVAGTHEELMLTIPSGKTIPANGFFLISNFDQGNSAISVEPDVFDPNVVLVNSDLRIKLYKGSWTDAGNLIDTADDGSSAPLAGVNSTNKQSMERNDDPITGWHTCTDSACNDTIFWDSEGNNYGTPKAVNLSENDPTSSDYVAPTVTPTPIQEATPTVNFYLRSDKKVVEFTVSNVNSFNKISYEIAYDSINGEKGIAGSADLTGENTFSRTDLLLGTCSGIEGKVCVYDEDITKFHLKATLFSGSEQTVLEKEINY